MKRGWIIGVVAMALLLRLGWVLSLDRSDASIAALPDQREYLELGRNLMDGVGLKFHDPRFDQDVYAFRMPGYPLLVALCGGNLTTIRIVQALLDASTVLGVYLLARRWMGERPSTIAATLVAINPFLIYFTGLILSETLYIAMLVWGLCFLTGGPPSPDTLGVTSPRSHYSAWPGLIGVLTLALSIHVRPSAMLLPILAPLVLRKSLWLPLFAAATMAVVLSPWALRNQRVLGQQIWTTTNSGFTIYDGFNPHADGSSNQWFVAQMPELKSMDEIARSNYLTLQAQNYAAQNRGRVVQLTLKKIARFWSPVPLSDQFGGKWSYIAVAAGYAIPLLLLGVWGIAAAPIPLRAKLFLLVPAVYFTIVHAASVASLRYRIPAEAPISVLAAGALWQPRRASVVS